MSYTVEKFSDEMNEALAVYVTDLANANDKYITTMEEMMVKAKGLDVRRVLDIVRGLQIRANAAKQRLG